jgi:hypothetical protein
VNPELQRNLWLEAPTRRLIGTAAVPALIFLLVWLVDRGNHPNAVVIAGATMFVGAAVIWAPREARAAVTDEVYARTWDFQRGCALAPWTLTWGKLVGATAQPWLLAGLSLLITFLQLASITSFSHALFWAIVALGLGVLMQASGLAVGLIEIRKSRAAGRPPGARSPGLAVLTLALLGAAAIIWAHTHMVWSADLHGGVLTPGRKPLIWWGATYDPVRFAAVSLGLFAVCAVGWAWRLMRLELQLRNLPWAWVAFMVIAALYAAGFDANPDADVGVLDHRLALAAAVCAVCAYLGALIEPADTVRARQFLAALNPLEDGLDLKRLVWTTPLVAKPLALTVILLVWDAMIRHRDAGAPQALLTLATLAFVLRDLGVIAALRFGRPGRGDFGVLMRLAMLYVVGALVGRLFGGAAGPALFIPTLNPVGLSLVAGGVQAALAWMWAGWRIAQPARSRKYSRLENTPAAA